MVLASGRPWAPGSKILFDCGLSCEILRRLDRFMIKRLLLCLTSVACLFPCLGAEKEKPSIDASKLPPIADKKDVTYGQDIKPIFEKSCFSCHGPEKAKGKLRLDSLAAALKGGED